MQEVIFLQLIDEDVIVLANETIAGLILGSFGIVGSFSALAAFLIFLSWGIYQIVKFMKNIINA